MCAVAAAAEPDAVPLDVDDQLATRLFPYNYKQLDQCAKWCNTWAGKQKCLDFISSLSSLTLPVEENSPAYGVDIGAKCCLKKGTPLPNAFVPSLTSYGPNGECLVLENDAEGEATEYEIESSDIKRSIYLVRWSLPQGNYTAWTYIFGFMDVMCSRMNRDPLTFLMSDNECGQLLSEINLLFDLLKDPQNDSSDTHSLTVVDIVDTFRKNVGKYVDTDTFCKWLLDRGVCILTHLWMRDYKDYKDRWIELMVSVSDFLHHLCCLKPELDISFISSFLRVNVLQAIRQRLIPAVGESKDYLIAAFHTLDLLSYTMDKLVQRGLCVDNNNSKGSSFLETMLLQSTIAVRDAFFLCIPLCAPSSSNAESWKAIKQCLILFNNVLDYVQHTVNPDFVQAMLEPFVFDNSFISRVHAILICGRQYSTDIPINACVVKTLWLLSRLIELSAESLTPLSLSLLKRTTLTLAELELLHLDSAALNKIMLCNIAELTHLFVWNSVSHTSVRIHAWRLLSWCCMLRIEGTDVPSPHTFSLSGIFTEQTPVICGPLEKLFEDADETNSEKDKTELSSAMIAALDFLHASTIYQPALASTLFEKDNGKVMSSIISLF